MSPAEAKLEAIRNVLEELLTSSGSGDPKAYAFNAVGEISAILDMEPMQVLDKLAEQEKRRLARTQKVTDPEKCLCDKVKGDNPYCPWHSQ